MMPIRLGDIAAVCGGRLHRAGGQELITSVEFDTRRIAPGGLFVTLPGTHVDGHELTAAALRAGAVAVLAGREVDAPSVIAPPAPPAAPGPHTYLAVTDPDRRGAAVLAALAHLARHTVDQLPGLTVVGVTGSSGKTSTKDLLAALLGPLGPTIAPTGSFNNELGLPITVLHAGHTTRHLVLEMAARRPGHIAALCVTAPPRIGVVLNVGTAHLEVFGSRQAIATAKGELVEALPSSTDGGIAVLNADDPLVAAMADRTRARVVTTGRGPAATVRATHIGFEAGRAHFQLLTPSGAAHVALRLVGEHHIANTLAAAAVAHELGATTDRIAEMLSTATPLSPWRMEITHRADGVTIVNDAYNANPESVRAALTAVIGLAEGRRTWAVLGPMNELGADTTTEHAQIAAAAAHLGITRLIAVNAPQYSASRCGAAEHVPDIDAALALLHAELCSDDIVLVKASRTAGLDRLATALLNNDPTRNHPTRKHPTRGDPPRPPTH